MPAEPARKKIHRKRLDHPDSTCPRVKDREMQNLVQAAWDAGWWCVLGGNEHVKCYPPSDQRMVPIPSTPSDWRTVKNKRAQLRRSGLKV